jgi:hypothetical protein
MNQDWNCLPENRSYDSPASPPLPPPPPPTTQAAFRLLTDFVYLYTYEFWLSLCKIVRSSVILLLPLFINILSVLHTKQFAYGDNKLLYVKWKPKALRTGVGRSKMTCGKCFGQYFRQLLRVVDSLRSVAARLNAVAGASAIALVFPA